MGNHKPSASENLKPIEILLVEDDNTLRTQIVRVLQKRGLRVSNAENGLEAKQMFIDSPSRFDLIISDVDMPGMTGVELLEFVRSSSEIPFIAMTGHSDLIATRNAYSMGATEFLPKPVSTEALLEAISHSLNPPEAKPIKA
ncbi:hypothetical protein BH10BDE1_BH10BDE1_02110 [soil metagenome]